MRVFLDANVLFSASRGESSIARLILWLTHVGEAVTSDLAYEEARRNVAAKRPAWIDGFDRLMTSIELVPSISFSLNIELDSKDVPLLCAAIRSKCQYFVTGDKRDFGHLYNQTIVGVTVITLLRLAELLADSQDC